MIRTRETTPSLGGPPRTTGTVLAFPAGQRPRREGPATGEPRGEILLFLGVRYERVAEPDAAPAAPRRCHS
ncbi:hypothetical protein [Methylobacterium planeticum]|uniref:Uncharacterized protein n=1 Tax=Methylobacterium planeticum TaxID=2615211 RepID=A0A6N6MWW1_9HYPH|nr:hypothetical protein [Methylobacterium planeticum]KAB1075551.1 hypothetical protein F6X51_02385 [Methylobacterium planeticum]